MGAATERLARKPKTGLGPESPGLASSLPEVADVGEWRTAAGTSCHSGNTPPQTATLLLDGSWPFHNEFGLPPHGDHLRVRLAACELVSRGRAVARVAYQCGFADQSHRSRRFKASPE